MKLIEANIIKKAIKLLCKDERASISATTYFALMELIDKIPTVENRSVKSTNWVSVKDKLPDEFVDVLVYYRYKTGTANRYAYAVADYSNSLGVWSCCNRALHVDVLWWKQLTKPPKESDTE